MCRLPKYACQFIEMCLMVTADHGPAVSGAHNTIVCARAGKDLISSLTSGLLTIVRHFDVFIFSNSTYLPRSIKRHQDIPAILCCFFRETDLEELWMLLQSSSAMHLIAACCPWSLSTKWRKMESSSWVLDTELSLWVIFMDQRWTHVEFS